MNKSYEIERKFLIKTLPAGLDTYPHYDIEQGYLCIDPVIRVRKKGSDYILTYKSQGLMKREEYEHPLTESGYEHLIKKADGNVISKTRYIIPEPSGLTIELDIFKKAFYGIVVAEIEFASVEDADRYTPPDWFGDDVTRNVHFHNSYMSRMGKDELLSFVLRYSHHSGHVTINGEAGRPDAL